MDNSDDSIRKLNFKYYHINGGQTWLHATYKSFNSSYEHSIIVPVSTELTKIIDERIAEALLAIKSYTYEHPENDGAAEVVRSNPRKATLPEDSSESVVISAKTPKQLEREDKEEADRMGGLSG